MADPSLSIELRPPKQRFKESNRSEINKQSEHTKFGPSKSGLTQPSWGVERSRVTSLQHLDCKSCAEETWEVAGTKKLLKGLKTVDIIQRQKKVESLLLSLHCEYLTSDHAYRGAVCKY